MTNGKFENNPFYALKDKIRFDKEYSEKDFHKDCWYIDGIKEKKLLTDDNVDLVVNFWVRQLEPEDRKIKKVAKNTIKYIASLKRIEKSDAKQK